jgi:hypothetical protein
MKKWWQRRWGLVRCFIRYHRERHLATSVDPRQDWPTCASDGADEAPQVDPAIAAQLRLLIRLFEAGKRELP